jgi:hypothetical protein
MKWTMSVTLILVLFTLSFAGEDIDALLKRSESSKSTMQLKGFIIQRQQMPLIPLTPPDSLFKDKKTSEKASEPSSESAQPTPIEYYRPISQFLSVREYDKDYKMFMDKQTKLEESNSKLMRIVKNLQDQSDSHTKDSNFILKLIESLTTAFGALGAIVASIFAFYKWSKSKNKDTQS